jgi:RNA polymerase sigma factor (sigma-70 family)
MPGGRLHSLIGRLRAAVPTADGPSDAQLLERFVRARDQAAFELLVWRHGPMVLSVCRRVLRREHDAEDAFQAAFLTLVRKAAAVGRRASVGGWLHTVAYRIALRARAGRRPVPLPAEPRPDVSGEGPPAALLRAELASALDEEIHRLPDKYRIAFILCQLEGRTAESAARSLGCAPATVGTRLARARDLLRRRLARRGLGATDGLAGLAPAPPAVLVDAAVRAALIGAADKAAAAGVISARAAALTKGALRTMSLTKWTLTTAVALTLGLLGGAAALLARPAAAPPAAKPAADPKEPGVALQWRFEKDRPFYQVWDVATRQAMKIQNNDVVQDQSQTITVRWTPKGQGDKGDGWILNQRIEGLKASMDLGGSKIEFDSTKDGHADNALSDFYNAVVGAEFEVTLDSANRVRQVDGRDEIVKKLAASARLAQGRQLAQSIVDDGVARFAETAFGALPAKPVRRGDSWTRTTKAAFGVADFQAEYTYLYEGKEGELDRIRVEVVLKDPSPSDGAPFKVKNVDLKRSDGTGFLLFDRDQGRIVHQELTLTLEGKLTIALNGQESEVQLSQTQKTTLRTTDANPLKPEAAGDDRKEIDRLREENERLRDENERLRLQLKLIEGALKRGGKP